ncbi:MAG: TSUP family transporter [Candidatus Pacebacteria bacterium]|nr:TSUP family transporter [Candidatus Paceibacterota bacterium]
MELIKLIFASFVVFLGHVIKSLSGFGAALFSLPLLAHFYPLTELIPVFILFDILTGLLVVSQARRRLAKKQVLLVFLGLFVGTSLGLKFLTEIDFWLLEKLFALIVALFAVQIGFIPDLSFKHRLPRWSAVLAGLLGGLAGVMFGVNGPPIVIYFSSQFKDKQVLRSSLFAVFLLDAVWRLVIYAGSSLISSYSWYLFVVSAPVGLFGLWIGSRAYAQISSLGIKKIASLLLLVNSFLLLIG